MQTRLFPEQDSQTIPMKHPGNQCRSRKRKRVSIR